MSTRTKADLAENVMRHLGLIPATETPAAADSQYIIKRYEDLMAELRGESLAYWPDNEVPYVVFEVMTELVGLSVGTAFGMGDLAENLEAARRLLKGRLRRHAAKDSSGLNMPMSYF